MLPELQTFGGRSDEQILSTLVHEMCHHWQAHFGKPGRGRYHNQEWADKMESMGLVATHTGEEGGKRVGQRLTHYIVTNGPFDRACADLFAGGIRLEWQSREWQTRRGKANASKTKYTCAKCGLNAWAKPTAHLICGECHCTLLSENA